MSHFTLSESGANAVAMLPPYAHGSEHIQRIMDCQAREMDRIRDAAEVVRENLWPQTGDAFLYLWEHFLGLPVAPPDKTLAQRRTTVLAWLQKMSNSGSGLDWEANMNRLIGTGWSYEEHDVNDAGSPPPYTLRITLPFGGELLTPGQPTAVASSGGTFAAATYEWVVTALNFYGETLPSPARALAVTANQRVTLDWPDVAGATGYRVYRRVQGSGQAFGLVASPTASTYSDTGTATGATEPPVQNTTQSVQAAEAEALARAITPANLDLVFGYGVGFIVGVSQVGEEFL